MFLEALRGQETVRICPMRNPFSIHVWARTRGSRCCRGRRRRLSSQPHLEEGGRDLRFCNGIRLKIRKILGVVDGAAEDESKACRAATRAAGVAARKNFSVVFWFQNECIETETETVSMISILICFALIHALNQLKTQEKIFWGKDEAFIKEERRSLPSRPSQLRVQI
jgi:hypothetical protein